MTRATMEKNHIDLLFMMNSMHFMIDEQTSICLNTNKQKG